MKSFKGGGRGLKMLKMLVKYWCNVISWILMRTENYNSQSSIIEKTENFLVSRQIWII